MRQYVAVMSALIARPDCFRAFSSHSVTSTRSGPYSPDQKASSLFLDAGGKDPNFFFGLTLLFRDEPFSVILVNRQAPKTEPRSTSAEPRLTSQPGRRAGQRRNRPCGKAGRVLHTRAQRWPPAHMSCAAGTSLPALLPRKRRPPPQ